MVEISNSEEEHTECFAEQTYHGIDRLQAFVYNVLFLSLFHQLLWSIDIIVCTVIDLLTVEPHTPTPEPVRYDKKDGQWYSHDGVDVTETQKRKGYCSELHVYVYHREYFNFSVIYTSLSIHNL